MSSCDFSIGDIRFRRRLADECDIVVFGETVGIVTKRHDIADPDDAGFYFALHLHDDHRDAVKPTIARMLVDRDLVPATPPPTYPAMI